MSQCTNFKSSIRPLPIKAVADDGSFTSALLGEKLCEKLWAHQLASVQTALSFERNNKNVKILKGIFSLKPGQGKTRVALALATLDPTDNDAADATVNTLIVVPNLLFEHWKKECAILGLLIITEKPTYAVYVTFTHDCRKNIIISTHRDINLVQNLYPYIRIIYDETDCLITHRGKRKVEFGTEPKYRWLLDGTHNKSDYFTVNKYTKFDYNDKRELKGTEQISYVPPTEHSSGKRGWGSEFFPINTVTCDDHFVEITQDLKLKNPIYIEHLIKKEFSDGVMVLSSKVRQYLENEDYVGLKIFMENDSEIQNVNLEDYCKHVLDRNKKSIASLQEETIKLQNLRKDNENTDETVRDVLKENIQNLQNTILRLEAEANLIESKITEADKCPICWSSISDNEDDPVAKAFLKCCYTQFCYICISKWLGNSNDHCPYCRASASISNIVMTNRDGKDLVGLKKGDLEAIKTKTEWLKKICSKSDEKILIYGSLKSVLSSNDYNYQYFGDLNVYNLQCNKNDADLIEKFCRADSGVNILYLDDKQNAKGHNFSFVDKIILYNPITENDKLTQIIGRVQRPGRSSEKTLEVHKFKLVN